ncbi:MAG: DNA mismatch repair endonuclease MutL [Planctomycetota bacterium]
MSEALSTPRIAVLSEVVRNQIAAGEVIERPASVVRELLDNAIDAGASEITIDLEEGGMRLVRITDNGIGMGPADLELAFEAHATSKLRSPEDLDHIASLGFRGEALASMASVARCRIRSRPRGAETGAEIIEEGGKRGRVTPAGMPPGTVIEVRDLFFNTPARRRFLKKDRTELGRCMAVIQRVALAHPADENGDGGVGLIVDHGGKRTFDVESSLDLLGRIRRIFGEELASHLQPVDKTAGKTRVWGYVAPPRFARRDSQRQIWFLNGRPLNDRVLTRVLKDAYRGVLVDGPRPTAFLHLSLDPETVDVNVHPAKSEVRLRDERPLFGFLVNALKEAVLKTDMATPGETMLESLRRREGPFRQRETLPDPGPLSGRQSEDGWIPRPEGRSGESSAGSSPGSGIQSGAALSPYGSPETQRASPGTYEIREVPGREGGAEPLAMGATGGDRVGEGVGWHSVDDLRGPYLQVDRTYLIRALPDGFEIVDQHALHERLTFEELRREVKDGKVEVQRLLTPELVELSNSDLTLLMTHKESLARIGVEVESFGDKTVAVHGLPVRIRRPNPEAIIQDMVEVIARTGKAPDAEDVLEEVLHRASCRSSIMAGDALDQSSIRALLERARDAGTDQTCPHARPTRVRFTIDDLEKAFHRK